MKKSIIILILLMSVPGFSQSLLKSYPGFNITGMHRKSFSDFHSMNQLHTYKDSTVVIFDTLNSDEWKEQEESAKVYKHNLWQFKDIQREYLTGMGIGVVGGLLGAMIGAGSHMVGDTTKSGSDLTTKIVIVAMEIGHFIGTTAGVNIGGHKSKVQGSIFFSAIGTALGDAGGIYLMTRDNSSTRFLGLAVTAIVSPLISAIFYNFTHNL